MNCASCKKNRITPKAVPFGGYICPKEHIQCHFCTIKAQGMCKLCKKQTTFLMMQCETQLLMQPHSSNYGTDIPSIDQSSTATFTFNDRIIDDIENKSMISQEELNFHDIDNLEVVCSMLPNEIVGEDATKSNIHESQSELKTSKPMKLLLNPQEHAQLETLFFSTNTEENSASNFMMSVRLDNNLLHVETSTKEALIGVKKIPTISRNMKPGEPLHTAFNFVNNDIQEDDDVHTVGECFSQNTSESINYGYFEHYVQNIEQLPTLNIPTKSRANQTNLVKHLTDCMDEKSEPLTTKYDTFENPNQKLRTHFSNEKNYLETDNTYVKINKQAKSLQTNKMEIVKENTNHLLVSSKKDKFDENNINLKKNYDLTKFKRGILEKAVIQPNFDKKVQVSSNDISYRSDRYDKKKFVKTKQSSQLRTYKNQIENVRQEASYISKGEIIDQLARSLSSERQEYKLDEYKRIAQPFDENENSKKFFVEEHRKIKLENETERNGEKLLKMRQAQKNQNAQERQSDYTVMKANVVPELSNLSDLPELCDYKKDLQHIDMRMQKVMETIQENPHSVETQKKKPETPFIQKSPETDKLSKIKSIPNNSNKISEKFEQQNNNYRSGIIKKSQRERQMDYTSDSENEVTDIIEFQDKEESFVSLYQRFAEKYSRVHRAVYKPSNGPFVRLTNEYMMTTLPEKQFEQINTFIGSLDELRELKKYAVKMEKVLACCLSVPRMPLLCPETTCRRLIFVSDFNNHLVYDHRTVIMERMPPSSIKNFLLDPRLVHNGISKCHVMYLVQQKVCDLGSSELKDSMPILLMTTRINLSKLYNWTQPAVAFTDPQKLFYRDEMEFRNERELEYILIWLTGVVPEDIPVSVHIAAWLNSGKSPICHTVYSGIMYSARKSHTPEDIWRSGEALAISTVDLVQLTNNESQMIQLQIFID